MNGSPKITPVGVEGLAARSSVITDSFPNPGNTQLDLCRGLVRGELRGHEGVVALDEKQRAPRGGLRRTRIFFGCRVARAGKVRHTASGIAPRSELYAEHAKKQWAHLQSTRAQEEIARRVALEARGLSAEEIERLCIEVPLEEPAARDRDAVSYYPPEEIFAPPTVASFHRKPVLLGHAVTHPLATDPTLRVVGMMANPRRSSDDRWILADISIDDDEALGAIDRGELGELSMGGTARFIPCGWDVPGVGMVDTIVREIRADHIALCEPGAGAFGLAGEPTRLRLDGCGDEEESETA